MVKWLVRVNASMAERISGISSNPADDLAFAKICTKDEEKIFVSCYSGWNSCFDSSEREILKMSSFHRSSPTHSREIFKEQSSSYICSQFCDNQHWCVGGEERVGGEGRLEVLQLTMKVFYQIGRFCLHILSQTVGVAGSG